MPFGSYENSNEQAIANDAFFDIEPIDGSTPLRVVRDWPRERTEAGDNWRRELFEAGDFDPAAAARILLEPPALARAVNQPGAWLLAPRAPDATLRPLLEGWQPVFAGHAWSLYRSAAPSAKGPEAPQHEGLPGCHAHSGKQRQP